MDINIGKEVNGTDIYGNVVKGEIIGISNVFKIATIKTGEDRLDITSISLDNINE